MANSSQKVILVGCGNMGRAMLEGWINSGKLPAGDAYVVEPVDALRQLAAELGVTCCASADDLPSNIDVDFIIFAVKPQVMFDVTPDYKPYVKNGAAIVSVAAGIGTEKFATEFGSNTSIIRVMPNTPAAISKGMMTIFNNGNVSAEQRKYIENLMAASGAVLTIDDESDMDAVTAVSGSGPAYVFHMIEALTAAGKKAGLSPEVATQLAEQTVYGAACYAKQSAETPTVLRQQVTSPNGTTAAALDVLMRDDAIEELLTAAVAASKKRSQELG